MGSYLLYSVEVTQKRHTVLRFITNCLSDNILYPSDIHIINARKSAIFPVSQVGTCVSILRC